MPNGDFVERVMDDGKESPLILRRNDKAILKAYKEFRDRVWWNQHQNWLYAIKAGEEPKPSKVLLAKAKKAARRIEQKYGKENLVLNDLEDWGILLGRMSALAWVTGSHWFESLDT